MSNVRQEIAIYTRACERLLSKEGTLTEDELSLVEFYVDELSRELLPDKHTVPQRCSANAVIKSTTTI